MKPSRGESGSASGVRGRSAQQTPSQTPEQSSGQIIAAFEAFLAEHPKAAVVEDGRVLSEMGSARYSIAESHGRCMLHLRDEECNIVRTVSAATLRASGLRLTTHRFGQ